MIKKGIIKQLIQNHDLKSLEQHLFYSFLIKQEINYQQSPVLSGIQGEFLD
jgi:hypothetical protein